MAGIADCCGCGDDSSMLHSFLARIAGFLYAKADRIVVVTSAFQEHLMQLGGPPRKLAVVKTALKPVVCSAAERPESEKEWNLRTNL